MKLIISDHNCFVNNKYAIWYQNIINNRLICPFEGPGEYHHFIPKSIIKNDNLVYLSLREHYICHLLLCKCVTNPYKKKMLYALTAMKMAPLRTIGYNSRLFEKFKIEANKHRSTSKKGVPRSEETKEKLRQANLGKKASTETKNKLSQKAKGRKRTPEQIEKTRQSHIGTKRSSEAKQKMSEANFNRSPIKCPFCGMESKNYGNMKRWHFDNCPKNPQSIKEYKIKNPLMEGGMNSQSTPVLINGTIYNSVIESSVAIGSGVENIISYLKGRKPLDNYVWEASYLPILSSNG